MKNPYSIIRNYIRHKILFNMPFALRLNLSIAGLLLAAFTLVFIFLTKLFIPMIKTQVEHQATETIGQIKKEILVNLKRAESADRLLNSYAYEDLTDDDRQLNVKRMAFMSRNVLKIIDPNHDVFHASFIYVAATEGRNDSFHQFFIDKEGKITIDSRTDIEVYRKREWMGALRNGKAMWTEPYVADDEPEKPVLISFTVPITVSGSTIPAQGVMGIAMELKNVQRLFGSIDFLKGGKALLLSKKGRYIYHPDENIQMKMTISELARQPGLKPLEKVAEDLAAGKSGKLAMEKSSIVEGKSVIVFYGTQPDTGWGICLTYSQGKLFATINKISYKLMAISGLAMMLLLFLVNILCKQLTKSLEKLAEISQEYGQGRFEAKFPNIYGKDEIGRLADAFRSMRDNIVKYIQKEKHSYAFEQKLSNELAIASQIQAASLEETFPEDSRFNVYAVMHPSKEVGGDFYDCFYLGDNKYAVLAADVSDKGIPAALFMMMSKTLLKTIAENGLPLAETFTRVNNAICARNKADMFVTAFMAVLDLDSGELEYVNAGHNPPLIHTAEGYDYFKPSKNIPIGVMQDYKYKSDKVYLVPGERLFLYTDGATDAQNEDGKFFGTERLKNVLNSLSPTCTAKDTINEVSEALLQYAGKSPQTDDITLLELYFKGNGKEIKTGNQDKSEIFTSEEENISNDNEIKKEETENTTTAEEDTKMNIEEMEDINEEPLEENNAMDAVENQETTSQETNIDEKRNFPARIEEWQTISDFLEEKAEAANLSMPKTMKVLVSAEEIFSNIVSYAYNEPGNAFISVEAKDNVFYVIFEDYGIPYNPLEKEDPDTTLSVEERKVGGLGIFIVKKSMDYAEYERREDKNIFRIGIKIS